MNAEDPRPAAPPGTACPAGMTGDGPFAHGQRPSRASRVFGVRCSRCPVHGLIRERGGQAGASRWGRMSRPPGKGPGHPLPFALSPGPRWLDWWAGLSVDTVRVTCAWFQRSERGLGAKWPQHPYASPDRLPCAQPSSLLRDPALGSSLFLRRDGPELSACPGVCEGLTGVREASPEGSRVACRSSCVVTAGTSPLSWGRGAVLGRALWVFLSSPLSQLVGFCSLSEWRGEAPKAALSCHLRAFPAVAEAS